MYRRDGTIMRPIAERRIPDDQRVPFPWPVAVSHDAYEGQFEAAGVNLSLGGMGLRAGFLPDVGDSLRCRFGTPTGHPVDVSGKVMWTRVISGQEGEFGLSFHEIRGEAAAMLQHVVFSPQATPDISPDQVPVFHPPAPVPSPPPASVHTRLRVDGVGRPVRGLILEEDSEGMVVEQPMPALRLGARVQVEGKGQSARIQGVDLVMEGDTPRVVMDLEFDGDEITLPDFGDEPAHPDPLPFVQPIKPAPVRPQGTHFTAHPAADDTDPERDALTVHRQAPPQARPAGTPANPGPQAMPSQSFAPSHRAPLPESAPASPPQPGADPATDAEALARWTSATTPPQEPHLGHWARDVARASWSNMVDGVAEAGHAIEDRWLPRVSELWCRATTVLRRFFALLFGRTVGPPARQKKRRTTSPMGTRAARPGHRRQQIRAGHGGWGRWVVGALLVTLGGLGLWRWLGPDDKSAHYSDNGYATDLEAYGIGTSPEESRGNKAVDPPSAYPIQRDNEPRVTTVNPYYASAASAQVPVADTEPGDKPEPPNPQQRAPSRPEPATAPAARGAALSKEVGDPAARGRTYLLRMSRPVKGLRAERLADGVKIIIPESLSLDRAGPIAASHPAVERSMILNRGEYAELTLIFAPGRAPRYRVVARGAAVEIIVAS